MRYWIEFGLNNGTALYLTYLLYSTWILGGVALIRRFARPRAVHENRLWRVALVATPLLALARVGSEHLTFAPVSGPDGLTVAGTTGWTLIAICGLAGVVALTLVCRVIATLHRDRRLLRGREDVGPSRTRSVVLAFCREQSCPAPRLTESDQVSTPVALGRSEICLPRASVDAMSDEEIRAVVAHEISHLQRRDNLWLTFAHTMERLFFVQPLHRLARRRLRESAEYVADEIAVGRTSDPEALVLALTRFAGARPSLSGRGATLAGVEFGRGSLLVRRVRRVLGSDLSTGTEPAEGRGRGALVILLVVGLLVLTWYTPAIVPACDCRFYGAFPLFEVPRS